jgi:hypothetical protein
MASTETTIEDFKTPTDFPSVQKFIEHVDKVGFTALLQPAYIHGINPYDSNSEKVSIFWNTKKRSDAANNIFKNFYKYSNLEDAYDSPPQYFEGEQERDVSGSFQDRSVIIINKNMQQVMDATFRPLVRSNELMQAFPDLFPNRDSLTNAISTLIQNFGSYLLIHELGHGSDYQDFFAYNMSDLPKPLHDIAREMHSDLTAMIHIINNPTLSESDVLPLIDGLIAKRAELLFDFNEEGSVTPFDTEHASLTGLFILRNMYIDDPELISRFSEYLISSLAAEITNNALMPSRVKVLTIATEAKNVTNLTEYVTFLEDFRAQADNITEYAYNITPTNIISKPSTNRF